MRKYHLSLLLIGIMVLSIMACTEEALNSDWKTPQISRVNPDSAWIHTSTYAWEDQNILLGLQNDADQMVILLRARDRATQATIMRAGLTIWFDPTGKKDKTFGIHYPIGRQIGPTQPTKDKTPEEKPIDFRMGQMPDTMEIIKQDKSIRIPLINDKGITVLTSNDLGTITFQFSVPMRAISDSSFGINASPGSIISLGFEAGASGFGRENRERERPEGGEGPTGGFGGRGGSGDWSEHRDSIPLRAPGGPRFEPVDFWTRVILATPEVKKD